MITCEHDWIMVRDAMLNKEGELVRSIICSKCEIEKPAYGMFVTEDATNRTTPYRCPFCKGKGYTAFEVENIYSPCAQCDKKGIIWA